MMDRPILDLRLTRGSSSRSRKLESELSAKQHLLVRLVAAINQHSGREKQYYAQLLRPHMDFMIHEFPVRIQVIEEQEDQEVLQILIQRGGDVRDILLDAVDAMAALQARADPYYIPPITSWRLPTPPTKRRPPRSTPKSTPSPPPPPAACSLQPSLTPEESSPPSPPAETNSPLPSTPEESPAPSQQVEDATPALPTSVHEDGVREVGSLELVRRDVRLELPGEDVADDSLIQGKARPASGGREPQKSAALPYGGECGHQPMEDTTPQSKEDTSSLPTPPPGCPPLGHQPQSPDPQQGRQLLPQLTPGDFHPDDYQAVHISRTGKILPIYDVKYGTWHSRVASISPALPAIAKGFHEDFGPTTIWNGGARVNPDTMERLEARISSEYKNIIYMFPSSAQDDSSSSYGQCHTGTSYHGTQRSSNSPSSGPHHSLRKKVRRPPPASSLGGLPLGGRPVPRDITEGPSLYKNSNQGVSADHRTQMVNCRGTDSASVPAMPLAMAFKLSANLCNKVKVVKISDFSKGRWCVKYRWRNYVPRWARNHLLSQCTRMNRRPTQSTISRLARTVTSTSKRSDWGILNSSQEAAGLGLTPEITWWNTQPESYLSMMAVVNPWSSVCNKTNMVMDGEMSHGHHHSRYKRGVTHGPWYAQPQLCNSLDQMTFLPVQSNLAALSLGDTRRLPRSTRPGSVPLTDLPLTLTYSTGSSPSSISSQGISGSLSSRIQRSLSRRTGSALPMLTGVDYDYDICNNHMFVGRRILPPDPHDDCSRRTGKDTTNFTMMYDRGSITTSMVAATFHRMRIKKTLQAPPWTNHSLHDDVRPTFPGNIPIAHTDAGPGTAHITLADDTLGTGYTMLPDVSLYQAYYDILHIRVQDLQSYPRGREDGRMKNSFLSFSECSAGLVTTESRKTTCPALKEGSRGCPAAAYKAMLRLYIQLQDFRLDMAQNWFLADILTKIEGEDRSSPTFSGNTSIYS